MSVIRRECAPFQDFLLNSFICTPATLAENIHTYIYIYIVIHRQTVSFYQNSSVWLDMQDARSRDRNPSNFTLDCDSDHSSTKRTTLAKGILRYFYFYRLCNLWSLDQSPVVGTGVLLQRLLWH